MERLGDEVARELARAGAGGAGSTAMPRVVEVWADVVGPSIARNAWPARVGRDGTLHVATESSAWAFELQHLESDILGRLRGALGADIPARLRFAVGKLPEHGRDEEGPTRRPRLEPTAHQRELAEELVAGIDDSDLRAVVVETVTMSLAEAAADRRFW